MSRTLQKKFIVTAMIAVTVLLLVLLGAINAVNAISSSSESNRLLDMLASREGFGPSPFSGGQAPGSDGQETPPPERQNSREIRGFLGRELDEDDRLAALTFTVRFDSAGELAGVNTERIASISDEEAEALGREALASGRDSGRLGGQLFRVVEPGPDCKTVVFLDVSSRRYELLRVAVLSGLGGLLAWLAMLALVTALSRRAIRPIARNIERQRQFVTDAGHELKTPLAIIQANLDAMELRGGENKYSCNIRSQTTRLSTLMQNLLTLSRLDESGALPDLAPLDLSAAAQEALEMFRAPAELKKLRVTAELPEGVTVTGSKALLQQLLSTLLDNAVKYCPEGGALTLRLRQEDRAVLTLANAVGEARPPIERMFDRFYRADSSRNQKGGFGIGLSAAQTIVRLHKGEIEAHYEGDTIVFTVKLPY